jgi:hypothetical protein
MYNGLRTTPWTQATPSVPEAIATREMLSRNTGCRGRGVSFIRNGLQSLPVNRFQETKSTEK